MVLSSFNVQIHKKIKEKIPYETKTVPIWDSSKRCAFIKKHKQDWQEISEMYDVPLESCRNLFVNYRAKPSLLYIRKFALDVDPIEFFIEGDTEDTSYIPEQGDVISFSGKKMLVVSNYTFNEENNSVIALYIEESCKNGIEIKLSDGRRELSLLSLATVGFSRNKPKFVEKLNKEQLKIVVEKMKNCF